MNSSGLSGCFFLYRYSDEFFVEDEMVKELGQYLKKNNVVVDFDPNKPGALLDPKPGVTKDKVQKVLES